jgi:hypothetical protein
MARLHTPNRFSTLSTRNSTQEKGMAKLRVFDLVHDDNTEKWDLVDRSTGKRKASFENKLDAIAGGVLAGALGAQGGSVRIRKLDGTIQEERTYPGNADPRSSKG